MNGRRKRWRRWFELRTVNEHHGSRRDPEERPIDSRDERQVREKMIDKTLADSFPTSDPPSTIPDPSEDSLDWDMTLGGAWRDPPNAICSVRPVWVSDARKVGSVTRMSASREQCLIVWCK